MITLHTKDTSKCPNPKDKTLVLQHCWKLLEHNEKLSMKDQEATPPKKGALIILDDDEDNDLDELNAK
jgi:hypothetical protein